MTTIRVYLPPDVTVEVVDKSVSPAAIPAWATDEALPPGAVRAISLNTMLSQWPGPPPVGSGSLQKAVDAWCSGIDAPLLGRFGSKVFCGGGDADGWDTTVYAFDYDTRLWYRLKERTTALSWNPGNDPQFNAEYGTHGDGTPAVAHSYDALCYLPPVAAGQDNGAMFWPVRRFYYAQRKSNWSYQLDLGPVAWRRRGNDAVPISLNAEASAEYDPFSGRVWMLPSTRSGTWVTALVYVEPSTNTVGSVPLSSNNTRALVTGPACLRMWCGFDGADRSLAWFQSDTFGGSPTPRFIDLAKPQLGIRSPLLDNPLPPMNEGAGLAWCAPLRAFFLKPSGPTTLASTLFKITTTDNIVDPWKVEEITLSGVTEVSNNGLWKKLEYVPALRALTWYEHADGAVYAYRPTGV